MGHFLIVDLLNNTEYRETQLMFRKKTHHLFRFEDLTLTLECRAEDMRGLDLLFKLQGQTIDTTAVLTLTKPKGKL